MENEVTEWKMKVLNGNEGIDWNIETLNGN